MPMTRVTGIFLYTGFWFTESGIEHLTQARGTALKAQAHCALLAFPSMAYMYCHAQWRLPAGSARPPGLRQIMTQPILYHQYYF